ncbi:MAG: PQQ-binding-like beta-propeller repeat protein [Acidobacteria bacterium]|nr:PQQ-binding-like beta-propeller repeat protein [Acidobacteriota bacterium]
MGFLARRSKRRGLDLPVAPRPTCLTLTVLLLCSCTPGPQNADWSTYLGDPGRRHYSELVQINRDNVRELEVAWIYDSGALVPGSRPVMYTSPLIIDGVLYGLSPRLVAFALDAETGDELWRYDPDAGGAAQRGLMWWRDNDRSRLFYTAGRELVALDPSTGQPVEDFGENGRVDLTPSGRSAPFFVSAPGVIFEDLIVLGFSTDEGDRAHAGSVRAYSAITGDLVWQFNSLPRPGEMGSETWADGALERAGGANNWTGMALDAERELVFVPTGSATPDFYGASRPGDNLFANCLLALDARTGELRSR